MFGLGKTKAQSSSLGLMLSDYGYSLVSLKDASTIQFCEQHYFTEISPRQIQKALAGDVEKYNLYGQACQIILHSSLYELILMDTPEVAESEVTKALRWQLKGLIDYPLTDIAVDTFIVPPHGAGDRRKKAFVGVTLQSALTAKIALFEESLLQVRAVSISELALGRLVSLAAPEDDSPCIVISFDEGICQLHVYNHGDLYLCRTLSIDNSIINPNSVANQDMLLEIQRSTDYCLMELKLAEPKHIFFTPHFYQAEDLMVYLQTELGKEVALLDINSFFTSEPLSPEDMAKSFYAIGGALMLLNGQSG